MYLLSKYLSQFFSTHNYYADAVQHLMTISTKKSLAAENVANGDFSNAAHKSHALEHFFCTEKQSQQFYRDLVVSPFFRSNLIRLTNFSGFFVFCVVAEFSN